MLLFSCNKEENINPNVVGKWKTTNIVYDFQANGNYTIVNKRTGTKENPIVADSIFGKFITNSDKSQLTFYQEGYRQKDTQTIVNQKSNLVWKYTIEGNQFQYSSPTTEGFLEKVID